MGFILVVCQSLLFSFTSFAETVGSTKSDSLRIIINTTSGAEKIAAQLDYAKNILPANKDEALDVAVLGVLGAKRMDDKTLLMRAYYLLGTIYTGHNNYALSHTYLDSALTIATAIDDNWYKGETLYRIGVNHYRMGKTLKALELFNVSIREARLANNYRNLAATYSMMGTIFRVNGFYDRAIEYIIKSKLNYQKADFEEGSAWAAYLLGRIYSDLKLQEKALEYFQEALSVYIKLAAIDGIKNGLAICYEQLGILHLESGDYIEARRNIEETRLIHVETESEYGMTNVFKHLGRIEYAVGNYVQAEKYLSEALEKKIGLNDLLSLPGVYEYLGLTQLQLGQVEIGFTTIKQGLELAISNKQRKMELDIYAKLGEAYLSFKDLGNAIVYQKKQIHLQNLILAGDANIKIEQLQAIYEIDEKNEQIVELEKENKIHTLNIQQNRTTRTIMILGTVLALFISIVIIWFYRKIRRKNHELNETNAAKDKLFAVIAHDLRGPTGGLANLLEHLSLRFDEFSAKELKELLLTLYQSAKNVSDLLENLLVWAQSQVSGIKCRPREFELNNVLHDSVQGLLQSAVNKKIEITFEPNKQLMVFADSDMVQTIVRNCVGNAIKFTDKGGAVSIYSVVKDANFALIRIVDSGVGMDQAKLKKLLHGKDNEHTKGTEGEESSGLGLVLIRDFVKKNKGSLHIESEKNKGTTVSFTLPLV